MNKSKEDELKLHTRRLSIKEGIFWSARASFGDRYIIPFAVLIGASNSIATIIGSLANLGLISQLFGAKQIENNTRKSIFKKAILIESLGWLIMFLLAIAYFKGLFTSIIPYVLIGVLSIIFLSVGAQHPAWFSWMGDVVDEKFRGRWFSKRSTIISFTTVIFAMSSAMLLNHSKSIGYEKPFFIILFGLAFLARAYTFTIVQRQYEPKRKTIKKDSYNFKFFLKEIKTSNFGTLVKFRTMLAFVMGITSPLYAIYLLRELQFDYISFMAIMLSGTLFSILTLNMWGKLADKYGNYTVIAIATLIVPLTPLLWTLSPSKIYLFFIPALIGGTAWSGFIMAARNFVYDNVASKKRGGAISYLNLCIGIAAVLGGLTSAYLLKITTIYFISPIITIMIGCTILRMIVIGIWVPKLKEITRKKKFKSIKEMEHIILKEIKPTLVEDVHEIAAIKDYIRE